MANKGEFSSQTNCINFDECPLCFKCRGFNPASAKCQTCKIEKCIKDTHTPKNINMMISRPIIKTSESIEFKNGNKE